MLIPFQQGIVQYGNLNGAQQFLILNGTNITLNVGSVPVIVTLSQLDTNYLITETATITNAWSITSINASCWLFWDINTLTGERTFGVTYVRPVFGPSIPSNPVDTQMWFNTTTNVMNLYSAHLNQWSVVIRVFAAALTNGQFVPMGLGIPPNLPFAGTQVGLNNQINAGEIVFDQNGAAILRSNTTFFTTVTTFFTQDNVITTGSLATNKLMVTAEENIPAGYVVALLPNGNARLALYSDIGNEILAISNEVILQTNVGEVTLNGVISNQQWSWGNSNTGNSLWIGAIDGSIQSTNLYVTDALNYTQNASAIGTIYNDTTIIFNPPNTGVVSNNNQITQSSNQTSLYSSISQLGSVFLTENPVEAEIPIAVGTNDPRMDNARVPLAHVQPASSIIVNQIGTYIPTPVNLQSLAAYLALTTGFTLTGNLLVGTNGLITIPNLPINPTDAANKSYVDQSVSTAINKQMLILTASILPNNTGVVGTISATTANITYKFIVNVEDTVIGNIQASELLVLVKNYSTCYTTSYAIVGSNIPYNLSVQSNSTQGLSITVINTNTNNIQVTIQQIV